MMGYRWAGVLLAVGLLSGCDDGATQRLENEMILLQERLVELNWEFTTTRSELNNKSKQSEVSAMVEPLGLQELTVPPHKIVTKDERR